MTAFHNIILSGQGLPEMPPGGSLESLLKSRIRRRRQFVDWCQMLAYSSHFPVSCTTYHGGGQEKRWRVEVRVQDHLVMSRLTSVQRNVKIGLNQELLTRITSYINELNASGHPPSRESHRAVQPHVFPLYNFPLSPQRVAHATAAWRASHGQITCAQLWHRA